MPRHLSRRDLLIAMLGLPAALAGCHAASVAKHEFAGEFVGLSLEIGHRLRDGWKAVPASDAWEKIDVVIVGGGVAGLSAAWRLRKTGFDDFAVVELESVAGGTSRGGKPAAGVSASTPFPWGAHYVPAPTHQNPALVELFGELGLFDGTDADGDPIVAEQFTVDDPSERLFYRGHWYEGLYLHAGASDDDIAQRRRFDAEIDRWVSWRDGSGRRAFTIPVALSSDDPDVTSLDRISMAEWLDRRQLNSPRLRWLVDYCCRDDYGLSAEQTSAWAGVFYFAARVTRSGAEARPLITWPGGNSRIVEHLSNSLQRQLRLDTVALNVAPREDGVDVVTAHRARDGRDGTVRGIHAKRVIFAAPQFLAKYVVDAFRRNSPRNLEPFQYGTWFVANLFLRGRPAETGFPLAWDNVLYDSPSLGYVNATHQTGPDFGPTVLTYYYPFCDADPRRARQRLLEMDWRECADLTLADLSRAHPDLGSLVERIDVMRWGHAMIRPMPGFMFGGARQAAAKPYRRIHFANTDLSGVALFEEAFYRGVRAAEEVLQTREFAVERKS